MPRPQKITSCLWFDSKAEEAATFYTGIFPNSRITQISRYDEAGREIHGETPGSVMVAAFKLDGQAFTALNGGPHPQFRFNEAISFQVSCETQAEVDHFWDRLSEGGEERAQQCGWLKTALGFPGRSFPASCPSCCAIPIPRSLRKPSRPCWG